MVAFGVSRLRMTATVASIASGYSLAELAPHGSLAVWHFDMPRSLLQPFIVVTLGRTFGPTNYSTSIFPVLE